MLNFHRIHKALLVPIFGLLLASCTKEYSASSAHNTNPNNATSATISVALDSAGKDSILILQPCNLGFFRDSLASASLPSAIRNFLDSNYIGFSYLKSFVIKDSAGATGGYVVIIQYNGKPIGLLFDASGNFVQILEQRQAGDMEGQGWHPGGRFCDRNGLQGDTVSLSSLPSSISAYFSGNYPNDTLLRAYQNIDSSYLVISKDSLLYANIFDSAGNFVKRIVLDPLPQAQPGDWTSIDQTALPSSAAAYLTTTYPNYVFEKAYSLSLHGALQGYVVIIDANNTKYAVSFDASGIFINAHIIW